MSVQIFRVKTIFNNSTFAHLHGTSIKQNKKTKYIYSKCPKISNTFLIVISNKMLINNVFMAGIHNMLVRIANREDPVQTASSKAA